MISENLVPDNPLAFIQQCVRERKIIWTFHVNMRLKGRFISRERILESISTFEIVEEYPEDKYLPSYLIYSQSQGSIFHVLFAVDVPGDNVRVITTYYPDIEEWEEDFKTRRKSL
jgi:hypothetical protein